jgi:hypothetical protein
MIAGSWEHRKSQSHLTDLVISYSRYSFYGRPIEVRSQSHLTDLVISYEKLGDTEITEELRQKVAIPPD